jgi:hypothetical protein
MQALAVVGDLGLDLLLPNELELCQRNFKFYDTDRDGKLTYSELLTCLRACGKNPTVDEFKELVAEVDTKLVRVQRLARGRRPSLTHHVHDLSLMCRPSSLVWQTVQLGALDFAGFMCMYVTELTQGPNTDADVFEARCRRLCPTDVARFSTRV